MMMKKQKPVKKNNKKNYIKINDNKIYNKKDLNNDAVINSYESSNNKYQYNDGSRSNYKRMFTQTNSAYSLDKKNKEENNKTYNKSNIKPNIKSNIINKCKIY